MVKNSTTIDTKLMDILTLFVLHGQLVQKRLNFKKCPGGKFALVKSSATFRPTPPIFVATAIAISPLPDLTHCVSDRTG